jgi:hypothetical protein
MRAHSYIPAVVTLFLLGCVSNYPLPVKEPPAQDSKKKSTEASLTSEPTDPEENRTEPDYQSGGLTPAKTLEQAARNLKIYGDSYQKSAENLMRNEYISSDVGYGGGVIGVIGGLVKSFQTTIAGALAATGSSIASNRYQLTVQAKNYERAANAMHCMYTALYPQTDLGLEVHYVNENIDKVRRDLRKAQYSVQLLSPDINLLKEVLGKKEASEKALADARQNKAKPDDLKAAEIKVLKDRLNECVVTLGEK